MSSGAKRFFKIFAKKIKESMGAGQYEANGINIGYNISTRRARTTTLHTVG